MKNFINKLRTNQIAHLIFEIFLIMLGTMIMSFSFTVLLEPNRLTPGGFMGLAQIIYYVLEQINFTAINISVWYLILNSVLYIFAVKKLGWKFGVKTGFGICFYSLFVEVFAKIQFFNSVAQKLALENASLMLYAIIGGIVMGIGMGLVFVAGGSTGGCDMLAMFVNKLFPTITTGQLVMSVDTFIVIISAIVYNSLVLPLYTLIAIYIIGKMSDIFVNSIQAVRIYYIVTNKKDEISTQILTKLKRGVTNIKCEGMYTKNEKNMLFVMVRRNQVNELKEIIKTTDDSAFMFATNIKEVYGNGFIQFTKKHNSNNNLFNKLFSKKHTDKNSKVTSNENILNNNQQPINNNEQVNINNQQK